MYFIRSILPTPSSLLIEARRSSWEIAYAAAIAVAAVFFFWVESLDGGPVRPSLLYAAGACMVWGLLAPFWARLTLIDFERGELVRERAFGTMYYRRVLAIQASAVRLERETWFGEARRDYYSRILIVSDGYDVHLGRVQDNVRALAVAEGIAAFLDVPLLDETDRVKRVLPIFGMMLTRYLDRERPVV